MARAHTYAEIAQAIARRIAGVADVGQVHEYQRYFNDEKTFKVLFFDETNERVCGWTVTRESWEESGSPNSGYQRRSTFVIRGYMGTDDANRTEIEFQKLIENVCAEIESQYTFDDTIELNDPPNLRLCAYGELFGVRCHHCEISIVAQEFWNN